MFLPGAGAGADGRSVLRTVDVQRDPVHQLQRITFTYRWFDAAARAHRRKQIFDLTFIFPRELQLLLERNGLRIEKMYGNYDASPLRNESPRIIAIATRL
jgi:hypothetical protein